jgi:hypothetical protein
MVNLVNVCTYNCVCMYVFAFQILNQCANFFSVEHCITVERQ